jgi:hypothetical protein
MLLAAGVMIRNKKSGGRAAKLLNSAPSSNVAASVSIMDPKDETNSENSRNANKVEDEKVDDGAVNEFWNAQVNEYHSQLKSYLMWGENHQKDADHLFADPDGGVSSFNLARSSLKLPMDFVPESRVGTENPSVTLSSIGLS